MGGHNPHPSRSAATVGCGRAASHEGRRRCHSPHPLGPFPRPSTPPPSPLSRGCAGRNEKGRQAAARVTHGPPSARRSLGRDSSWHRGSPASRPARAGGAADTMVCTQRAIGGADHRHARALSPPPAFPRLSSPRPATPRRCHRRKLRERRRQQAPGACRLRHQRRRHCAAWSALASGDVLPPTQPALPTVAAAAAATVATPPRSRQGGYISGGVTATGCHRRRRHVQPPPPSPPCAAASAATAATIRPEVALHLQYACLAAEEYPRPRPRRPRGRHHSQSPWSPRAPTTGSSDGGCAGARAPDAGDSQCWDRQKRRQCLECRVDGVVDALNDTRLS